MDIDAYIASGVLENYCLGFCSTEENMVIEEYANQYPVISKEIDKIRHSLEDYFKANEIKPSPAVKISLMRHIYKQTAETDISFPPLIDEADPSNALAEWIAARDIKKPDTDFENLFVVDLPSTEQVTNFFVHSKAGHEEEMHDSFVEYLYVIKGSCVMDFAGEKVAYKAGEIITIRPNIKHTATVTSIEPMIALVQRQACA